ncbi:MAG: glycerol-3-phosphate 1-O-acyltransferase PlsY [Bacillota bacterium]|nr:glycerol-3-phosphate 1-O-acyltransferase PlsY [Bacillota bacterium]
MIIVISILISFLCGSIPTGYLIAKNFYGTDIRTKGSGNIGSTNMKRIIGLKAAIITQIIDIVKGIIPVAAGMYLISVVKLPVSDNVYLSILAIAAILGHNFTPFLSFNGGKGVNTTAGAFVLIAPIPTVTAVAMHYILKPLIKVVAIRSILGGLILVIMCTLMGYSSQIIIAAIAACMLIVLRHIGNLSKLLSKDDSVGQTGINMK